MVASGTGTSHFVTGTFEHRVGVFSLQTRILPLKLTILCRWQGCSLNAKVTGISGITITLIKKKKGNEMFVKVTLSILFCI